MEKKKVSVFLAFLLLSVVLQIGLVTRSSLVMAHSDVLLSAWTWNQPTIDGVINAAEWSAAAKINFSLTASSLVYNGTIYVMNDYENLYLAAKITDDDFGTNESTVDIFGFFFENDHDGIPHEQGDDGLVCASISGLPLDIFYVAGDGWPTDSADGGTQDGTASASGDGIYNYFEFVHPLNSMDDAHDFSLKIGDVVGFCVAYADNGLNSSPNPFDVIWGWHDIKIAAPFWQGDLVLSDNDVYIITGEFNINGSIVVTENATLIIENAHLMFTQTAPFQFNITLKDAFGGKPRLIMDSITINTNTHSFRIELFENSIAQIDGAQLAPNCPVYLLLYDLSSAKVSNSTFTEISLCENASLVLSSSHVSLLTASGSSFIRAHHAYVESVNISGSSEVNAENSRASNVYMYGFSVLRAVNSTVITTNVQGRSLIFVNWYLDVHVVDSTGQNVPGANITVVCSDGTETAREQTNATGWARLTVLSSIINATCEYPQGSHNITVSYETYSNITTINVTRNMQVTVMLSDFIIPEFPTVPLLLMALLTVSSTVLVFRMNKNAREKR